MSTPPDALVALYPDTGACARMRSKRDALPRDTNRVFTSQGLARLSPSSSSHESLQAAATSQAPSWSTPADGSFAPTRSARAPPVAQSPRRRSEHRPRRTKPGQSRAVGANDSAACALLSRKSDGHTIPPIISLARDACWRPLAGASGQKDRVRRHALRSRATHRSLGTDGNSVCSRSPAAWG